MADHRHHHLSEPATAVQHFGDRSGSMGTLNVEAQGLVSADGLTIEGADTNTSGPEPVLFNWYFARR